MTAEDDRARLDPRVLRTRKLLQEALLALAGEKAFTTITVADVTDRATVNRSTFYQHYPDTDTLLADALDDQARQFGLYEGNVERRTSTEEPPATLLRYAQLIAQHVDLYRDALGPHGSTVAASRLHERFRGLAFESMRARGVEPMPGEIPADVFVAGIAGTVFAVYGAWIQTDPLPPPEDAARWAWSMVTGRTASDVVDRASGPQENQAPPLTSSTAPVANAAPGDAR